ncbi:MAG: hypothetical protein IPM00_06945 [Tetrasphaera sp.]|nr:hypothetical protein [Tetrasphaera sp.]
MRDRGHGRAQVCGRYTRGQRLTDTETILAADPTAVTPPVANEDAAWEALATHADGLLRIVTAALTADLD